MKNKLNFRKLFNIALVSFFFLFIFSFFGYINPYLEWLFFLIVSILYAILCWKDKELAFLAILAELGISGFGYLLYADLGFFKISLRMIMFVIFLLVSLKDFDKFFISKIKNQNYYFIPFLAFFGFFLLMAFIGFLKYPILIVYQDFNGYLFYLLLIPLSQSLFKSSEEFQSKFLEILSAVVVWQFLMAFFLEFIFSHHLIYQEVLPITYKWLRDLRVVEIGLFKGNFYRIFSQSFIWSVFAFFIFNNFDDKKSIDWKQFLLVSFCLFTILISLSRSFWIGILFAFLVETKFRFLARFRPLFINVFAGIFAFLMIFAIFLIPGAGKDGKLAFLALKERTTKTQDLAIKSRWSQLPVLLSEISKSPVFGYGFGKTITYKNYDPKVKGEYKTFAFEWGYLDILLKTGIFGLFLYLWFLISILRLLFKNQKYELFCGFIALMIIHFFTPYLNHPLGIGYVLVNYKLKIKN